MPFSATDSCLFCAEARNPGIARTFLSRTWPHSNRLIFSDATVFAVPGYSPQVYPYVLILPRRHTLSMAETRPDERKSVFECLKFLFDLGAFNTNDLYVFEHGGCISPSASHACVDHAHFHVIPGSIDIFTDFVLQKRPTPFAITQHSQIDYDRYLFAGVYRGGISVDGFIAESHVPERQYFRRLIARKIGDPRWNWRLGINEDYMLALKNLTLANGSQGSG